MALFREKNMSRISSPEQLNDYMKVTGVHVWVILAAVIFLLCAVVLWGALGTIESKFVADGYSVDGVVTLEIKPEDAGKITAGQEVEINGCKGIVQMIDERSGSYMVIITAENLPDMSGNIEVIVERVTPFSLVL